MNLLQSLWRRSASTTRRYDGAEFAGIDPLDFAWSFGGTTYTGLPGATSNKAETLESNFLGIVQGAYKRNGVIFACERLRLSVFSEARFMFREIRKGRPGDLFGDSNDLRTSGSRSLALLASPWPNGTTGDLLTRTLQDADLAGNAYWTVRDGRLRRMRPDWVAIVMGSRDDPDIGPDDLDAELLGYAYFPGGPFNKQTDPVYLLPDEVAHFAPIPDPIAHYRGMSWITPILREVEADTAATVHKLAFFTNGATLQTIVSFKDMKQEVFEAFVKKMDLAHKGAQNAYKTLYLGGGADATVVGADLRQLDFKATQGAGETRISAAAGCPAALVGLSEGLQGSSLNAGNLGQLRRQFAEGTMSTLWRNAAASFATLVPPPTGAELWYDTRDIPFLREDRSDRANIQREQAATIVSLATGGFTRDSAIKAVVSEDMTLLVEDPNWVSVQLQQSNGGGPAVRPTPASAVSPPPAAGLAAGRGPKARAVATRAFNPAEPREPHSGKWTGGGALKDALQLAEKGGLQDGETVLGSSKVAGREGDVFLALTDLNGERRLRFGVPAGDESGNTPAWTGGDEFTATLDGRQSRILRGGLDELDQMGRKRVKEADAAAAKMDAHPEGSPQYKAAQDAYFEIAGDGQLVGDGTARGEDGRFVVYRMVMVDEPEVYVAVRPTGAPSDWDVQDATNRGEGARLDMGEFRRLRKQMATLVDSGG